MEFLSISALDLFASALGIFVLMAILLFPFYLRQPSLEVELAGARAELSASGEALEEAERTAQTEALRVAQASAALARARARLQEAEAEAAAATRDLEQSSVAASVDERPAAARRTTPLAIDDLDLVFVMDTTGSMRNELADLQANLLGVIRVLSRLSPSLRVGFVAFRDHGDAYVTRSFPISPITEDNVAQLVRFVGGLTAEGGGDDPEPVDEALAVAAAMDWRADAQGRIIVIGDAPTRPPGRERALALAAWFRGSAADPAWPRTVSAIFTGRAPVARTLFEQIAHTGGGDFSPYQGQIIENVLLSVLSGRGGQASR